MVAEPVRSARAGVALAAACVLAACSSTLPPATLAPETGQRVVAEHAVVASAHPRASDAGLEMLRQGGNAVDAAVATAFAVSVGEPQMSGLGGGGGMLVWLADEGRADYVDFYASQPRSAFRGLGPDDAAWLRGSAIPGEVAGLLEAHERFGRLTREQVMAPAIRLAEEGVPVNQILAQMIAGDSAKLWRDADAREAFWPDGRPLQPGDVLLQPELAASLRRIASGGRDAFYRGELARQVVAQLNEGRHPATVEDLADYRAQWKRPVCTTYRDYVVLSAPPPQTGMQIAETLNLIERHDIAALGLPTRSERAFDVLVSALRVGIADGRLINDPRWVEVPAEGVVSDAFAAERGGTLVGTGTAAEEVEPAEPGRIPAQPPAPGCRAYDPYVAPAPAEGSVAVAARADDVGETTHISVVDGSGNAVALTHTNSSLFGSGARVAGFFINDSGIDFSRGAASTGPVASDWRTRKSTISPTVILRDGRVEMVVGAPGGGRIPTAVVQSIVYMLDYGMDPMEAVRMPRLFPSAENTRVQMENGFDAATLAAVRAMGYEPAALSFGYARMYVVRRAGDRWIGVADPRHNGGVSGY